MLKLILTPTFVLLSLSKNKSNFWQYFLALTSFFLFFLIKILYFPLRSYNFSSRKFFIDPIRISLIFLIFWIYIIIMLARWKILLSNNRAKEFFFWSTLLVMILILSFSFNNSLFFYFRFEARLIPTIVIILGWGYQPERLQASSYIILYTVCASLPLLIMLLKIYLGLNSLRFYFSELIGELFYLNLNKIIWIFVILAFLVKLPIFFFHLWLPKAHVEAPVAGSIILAGVLLKLGRYGFLRIVRIFPLFNMSFFRKISSICLWGGLVTRFICLRQVDIKSLVAYSSVGHISLLLGGSLRGTSWGWQRSLIIILAHGLCSSGLFILSNLIYEKTYNRRIFLIKGLLNIFPNLIFWWFILNIINIAAPPSLNLARELILISSIVSCTNLSIIILGIISFIAAGYRLFLYRTISHGKVSHYLLLKENINSR
jgi:NADH-ubiquinone oxidoreductase chain 4